MANVILPQIITRRQAKELGLKKYFTGKPCKNGHMAQRSLTSGCGECSKENSRKWVNANQEKAKLNSKKSYKKWRALNPEKKKEKDTRWRRGNPEKQKEAYTRWKKANPEKLRAHSRNREAKKLLVGGSHTEKDIIFLLKTQNYKCLNCGCCVKKARHVDHIMPLALGGNNDRKNLQILCPKCNMSKKIKHPIDWAQENGRLL